MNETIIARNSSQRRSKSYIHQVATYITLQVLALSTVTLIQQPVTKTG